LSDINKGRKNTPESIKKMKQTKLNRTEKQKEDRLRKYKQTMLDRYGAECLPGWSKGLTKETDKRLLKTSINVSKTMRKNPKLQFNYRLAQKKKNGIKFGGEERFEWCLKKAEYIEGKDYVYNKSVKVFDDLSRNSFRYFYPDFLLFGCKIIEVDGVYHDDKEQKLVDLTRTRILERNGYRLGARISHEEVIKNKEYMFNIIEYLKELKKCSEHKSVTANDLIHGDIKNAINCRN